MMRASLCLDRDFVYDLSVWAAFWIYRDIFFSIFLFLVETVFIDGVGKDDASKY